MYTEDEKKESENKIKGIDFILSGMVNRVLNNRKIAEKINEKNDDIKSVKERSPKISVEDSLKNLKDGDILNTEQFFHFKEKYAFESDIKFSKIQSNIALNKIVDNNYEWEYSLDKNEENSESKKEISLDYDNENEKKHIIDIETFFQFSEFSGIKTQGTKNFVPFPSDEILIKMVKLWSMRGAWDCCVGVCTSFFLRKNILLGGEYSSNESKNENKTENKKDMSLDDYFSYYNKNTLSPLSLCYRYTVRSLCTNNQYNTALLLTEKIKKLGIIITPTSLANLLLIFEINEDLSNIKNNDKVTLLEFQNEILKVCLIGAKFEKKKKEFLNASKLKNITDNIDNNISNNNNNNNSNNNYNNNKIKKYNYHDKDNDDKYNFNSEMEESETGELISMNIRLLCERGKYLSTLHNRVEE